MSLREPHIKPLCPQGQSSAPVALVIAALIAAVELAAVVMAVILA